MASFFRSFCGGSSSSSVRPCDLRAGPDHGRLALVPLEGVARCLCGEEQLPKALTEHIGKVLMIMRPWSFRAPFKAFEGMF